jgi:hypothetical protein
LTKAEFDEYFANLRPHYEGEKKIEEVREASVRGQADELTTNTYLRTRLEEDMLFMKEWEEFFPDIELPSFLDVLEGPLEGMNNKDEVRAIHAFSQELIKRLQTMV